MRIIRWLSNALLGALALSALAIHAEERSIRLTHPDGRMVYMCFASSCFESGKLQEQYDAKLKYIKNHACRNASPSTNQHCKDENEHLQAIKQCANNYCNAARCLEKNITNGRCQNSVFRR